MNQINNVFHRISNSPVFFSDELPKLYQAIVSADYNFNEDCFGDVSTESLFFVEFVQSLATLTYII